MPRISLPGVLPVVLLVLSCFLASGWNFQNEVQDFVSQTGQDSPVEVVSHDRSQVTSESYVIPWKRTGSRSWLFTTTRQPRYYTVSDYAPSNAVLMSHSVAWEPIVEDIIREIEVPVFLVSEDQDGEISLGLALQRWSQGLKRKKVYSLAYDVDSAWVRDYGPIQQYSRLTGRVRWLDGDYHPDRKRDDQLPKYLGQLTGVPTKRLPEKIEGGALISNGHGLCASTEEYIVSAGLYAGLRNPKKRDRLLVTLGCKTLVLLPALPDEQTMHVDLFLQFVDKDRLIVAHANPTKWPRLANLLRISEQRMLEAARFQGIHLKMHRVSIPRIDREIYYTYINGIRVNGRFLVPSFNEVSMQAEESAYSQLVQAMPGTEIVPIDARELPRYLGLFHCLVVGLNLPQQQLHRLQMPRSRKFPRSRRRKRPVRT